MPIFVALGRNTAEGIRNMDGLTRRHQAAVARAERAGAKVLGSYALGGPYDYLVVLDCPDEKTALKVLTQEATRGSVRYETFVAVPMSEFAEAMDS